jgi:hypothetical protein
MLGGLEEIDLVPGYLEIPCADNKIIDAFRNKGERPVVSDHLTCGMSGSYPLLKDFGIRHCVIRRDIKCPCISVNAGRDLIHVPDDQLPRTLLSGIQHEIEAAFLGGSLNSRADCEEGLVLAVTQCPIIDDPKEAGDKTGV